VEVLPEDRAEIGGDLLETIVGGQCVEQHSTPCVTGPDSARLRHRPRRSQARKMRGVLSRARVALGSHYWINQESNRVPHKTTN
jgi:hypothetical protein